MRVRVFEECCIAHSNASKSLNDLLAGVFSLINCLGVPVSCGVPLGVSIATKNTNVPLTHLEDVEYRCEHVHAIDGDPKSITSFRVVRAVARRKSLHTQARLFDF